MRCAFFYPCLTGDVGRVLAWLETDPVMNGLPLGLLRGLVDGLIADEGRPLLVQVEDGGELVGVALRTGGQRRLVLSPMPPTAAAAIAASVHGGGYRLPGVVGPVPAASAFAAAWTELSGQHSELAMAQRLHRLDRVISPDGVPGGVRNAQTSELDLIFKWATAFEEEAGLDAGRRDLRLAEQISRRIGDGRMPIWEVDGEVVSMAGPNRPAADVVRIGLVYTAPKHRQRGYAAACVAAVSQQALDNGAIACTLYTDLSNSTSNGIYRRIGYQPVCDAEELTFLPRADAACAGTPKV